MKVLAILATLSSVCGCRVPYSAGDPSYTDVCGLTDSQVVACATWHDGYGGDGVGVPIWMDDGEQWEEKKEREREARDRGHAGSERDVFDYVDYCRENE